MNYSLTHRRGNIEYRKDRLMLDLKGVVVDADLLLNEVADSTVEEFAATRTRIEARLREARGRLDDARIAIARSASHAADATEEYVRENPWKSFGLPAVAALAVFVLLSRR